MDHKYAYEYLTRSSVVHRTKCRVKLIIVTPDGTNASYADIYNGESTNDPQVARLRVPTTQSIPFDFGDDFILERGLYVDFGTNLSRVTVVSEPTE
jgi:hypothetical protein